ncbi:MAG: acyl-ACP--UDP-N-acetylglucosamine O-acyltransferase [Alcanivoracaceae bacterium]|nr:acyl-ACP--UDP-N-acetylglucosamine O-acyltransferase [Alcanivoracaceae bacterium]
MIHPTAIIDPKAELAADVQVGPYSVIGPDVVIGAGCVIGPHVVINGPTTIGAGNRIFQFASVGEECQDKKYKGEPTRLEIGDNNVIRESVTIHRGTIQDNSLTRIGSDNLLMAYVHVAHDCIVGSNCILANNASLAGHVHVGDGVILGGFTGVHQFCKIGSFAMSSMFSAINMDVPSFVMVQGYPARARGMNYEGMKRRGYSKELISELRSAYRTLYRSGLTLNEALERIEPDAQTSPEIALFFESLKNSNRGITRE